MTRCKACGTWRRKLDSEKQCVRTKSEQCIARSISRKPLVRWLQEKMARKAHPLATHDQTMGGEIA